MDMAVGLPAVAQVEAASTSVCVAKALRLEGDRILSFLPSSIVIRSISRGLHAGHDALHNFTRLTNVKDTPPHCRWPNGQWTLVRRWQLSFWLASVAATWR
jgi:hypothetical protein